jgi:hypothetical protein
MSVDCRGHGSCSVTVQLWQLPVVSRYLARLGLKPTREAGRWRAVWA